MKGQKRWLSFGLIQLVLITLWGICLYRAFMFFLSTRTMFILTQSGDAAGDFGFSQRILFCYIVSFFIGTTLVWFMCQLRLPSLLVPVLLICLTAVYLINRQPEQVIVLFPSLSPFLALLINLCAGAIGGVIIARRKHQLRLRIKIHEV